MPLVNCREESWNNLEDLELLDPCVEGVDGVPEAEEAMLLALVHAVQMLELDTEHSVDEPPIGDLVEACRRKLVLPDNLGPDGVLPGHGLVELEPAVLPFVAGPVDPEMVGQYRPEVLPLVDIPVAAVEGLVLGEGVDGGPDLVLGDEVRVGGR